MQAARYRRGVSLERNMIIIERTPMQEKYSIKSEFRRTNCLAISIATATSFRAEVARSFPASLGKATTAQWNFFPISPTEHAHVKCNTVVHLWKFNQFWVQARIVLSRSPHFQSQIKGPNNHKSRWKNRRRNAVEFLFTWVSRQTKSIAMDMGILVGEKGGNVRTTRAITLP